MGNVFCVKNGTISSWQGSPPAFSHSLIYSYNFLKIYIFISSILWQEKKEYNKIKQKGFNSTYRKDMA